MGKGASYKGWRGQKRAKSRRKFYADGEHWFRRILKEMAQSPRAKAWLAANPFK
jgi:uncharacterized Zn finger protein